MKKEEEGGSRKVPVVNKKIGWKSKRAVRMRANPHVLEGLY
jgi:hypothetical protein